MGIQSKFYGRPPLPPLLDQALVLLIDLIAWTIKDRPT